MRATRRARVICVVAAAIGIVASPARAQWQPPIGIPNPSFGITQTAPAAPNPWTAATPGFYYVEPTKTGATNVNNPYGTPAKPRLSIPLVLPAGSVVELHGFYDQPHSSPNGLVAQGTAAKPVFIRGASINNRPIIRRNWEMRGTYYILENLEFAPAADQSTTGSMVILSPTSHGALRFSEMHGTLNEGGLAVENWDGGATTVDNVVIYANSLHDNGDVNATYDQDNEGLHIGAYVHHVWVVDNELYRNSGDGIQINATEPLKPTTHHIYVGRNVSHHNKQGGFWVKQAVDVIFSQNVAYSHRPGNSSQGHCLGGQYGPDYVWWIYNRAYDCEYGIALMSNYAAGPVTHSFFVGNVISNIHQTTLGIPSDDPWAPSAIMMAGGDERHVVNNTIYNVDAGVHVASPEGSLELKNNIITNVSLGNHFNIGFESVGANSAIDHNLLFPNPRMGYDGGNYALNSTAMAQMKSIAKDPLFRNAAASDFHISANSPASASGEMSGVYATFQQRYGLSILVDADGAPRPQTAWMDMGAYGFGTWGLMAVDSPVQNSVLGNSFLVGGWSIDRNAPTGTGVSAVHIWATPSGGGAPIFLGVASYGGSRPDVGAVYGSQFTNSGFSLMVPWLATGNYTLTAYGFSTVTGAFSITSNVAITVSGPVSQPGMVLDRPSSGSMNGRNLLISGWAIDLGAPTGTGVDMVHVWAFPTTGGAGIFLGAATYGVSRPDVGAAFGNSRFTNSGYTLTAALAPGSYTFSVYMRSTVTGTFSTVVNATNVTVLASFAQGNIDSPSAGTTTARPFAMWGWAADTGAATGTGIDLVHVWAFPVGGGAPVFVGAATYGQARPDIGTYYLGASRFNNSGYSILVNSGNLPTPGTYDLRVYGRSTVTGSFSMERTVRVTVQ